MTLYPKTTYYNSSILPKYIRNNFIPISTLK